MRRPPAAPVLLAGLLLLIGGCDERSRSRVDGTDRPADAGVLDRGAASDTSPMADAIGPIADAAPPDNALPDAAPTDAAPTDAIPADAAPFDERDVYRRATEHDGRSGCPRISPARVAEPGRVWWYVAARTAGLGQTLGDRWVGNPIRPPDGPGIPEYSGVEETLRAIRWADAYTAYGLWQSADGGGLSAGPFGNRGFVASGVGGDGPIVDAPEAFDIATAPTGLTATLLPTADGLTLVLDRGGDARAEVVRWPIERVGSAHIAVDEDGVVVGWSAGEAIELRAVDPFGGPRWQRRLDSVTTAFDLALRPGRVGLVHITADDRLADQPFSAGYGRPNITVLDRADGDPLWTAPLHPDPIRGGDPAIGARADGWLTAWARLRVDGDRNRTEIEAAVVADARPGPPLRITRAHGFSFCPDVGDAVEGLSVIAWMDTREGREEIFTALGDFADWSGPDRPEPTPAPPGFADACDLAVAAVDGPVAGFDALPAGDGFRAVWIDEDGVITAGDIDPVTGPTVLWRLPDEATPDAVRIAVSGDDAWLFATYPDEARRWHAERLPPPAEPPFAPIPSPARTAVPLHAVAAGPSGVMIVAGDPPAAGRVEGAVAPFAALPDDARGISALPLGRDFVVGWLTGDPADPDRPQRLAWLTLRDDDRSVEQVEPTAAGLRSLSTAQDGALWADGDGWRYVYSAHRGRSFARTVLSWLPEGGRARALDLDAAASRRPVAHPGGTLWLEERPIQRYQVHFRPIDGGPEDVERLPIPGPQRSRFFLNVVDGDPVVMWTAGAQVFVARFPPECRLPAASHP